MSDALQYIAVATIIALSAYLYIRSRRAKKQEKHCAGCPLLDTCKKKPRG